MKEYNGFAIGKFEKEADGKTIFYETEDGCLNCGNDRMEFLRSNEYPIAYGIYECSKCGWRFNKPRFNKIPKRR